MSLSAAIERNLAVYLTSPACSLVLLLHQRGTAVVAQPFCTDGLPSRMLSLSLPGLRRASRADLRHAHGLRADGRPGLRQLICQVKRREHSHAQGVRCLPVRSHGTHLGIDVSGQFANVLRILPRKMIELIVDLHRHVFMRAAVRFSRPSQPHNSSASSCSRHRSTRCRTCSRSARNACNSLCS